MGVFIDKKFDVVLTGEEIMFIEYLMLEKLSNLKGKSDSRKIYDRLFDKFLLIKNKNKFFENMSSDDLNNMFEPKTNDSNLNINSKEIKPDIYIMPVSESGIKNNMSDMNQKREVLSFSDFVKLQENAITPVNPDIKPAAPREDGDVNFDRKNIDMITPMDDVALTPNGQNQELAPDDIQKDDEKEADKMSKEAEDLNKESDFNPEDEGTDPEDYNKAKK